MKQISSQKPNPKKLNQTKKFLEIHSWKKRKEKKRGFFVDLNTNTSKKKKKKRKRKRKNKRTWCGCQMAVETQAAIETLAAI